MAVLIILGLFSLLAYLSHSISRSFLHPASLISAWWLFGILFINLSSTFNNISAFTYLYYLFGIFIFCIGSATFDIMKRATTKNHQVNEHFSQRLDDALLSLFCLYCIVIFPIFIKPYLSLLLAGDLNYYLISIRTEAVSGNSILASQNFLLRSLPSVSMITTFFCFLQLQTQRRHPFFIVQFTCVVVIGLLTNTIEGARSEAIRMLVMLMFMSLLLRGVQVKTVFKYSALVGSIFFTISYFMEKGISYKATIVENILSYYDYLATYMFGGIISFDYVLQHFDGFKLSNAYTYNWLLILLNKIGLDWFGTSASNLTMSDSGYFIIISNSKKISTNVYTFFFPYLNDFGLIGSLIILYILGFISSILFHKHHHNMFSTIAYSVVTTAIMLSFFSDYFLRSAILLIEIFLFYTVLYKIRPFSRIKIIGTIPKTKVVDFDPSQTDENALLKRKIPPGSLPCPLESRKWEEPVEI